MAKMKTVLPFTREHNFQGFGRSGFGPFRDLFPNLFQGTPKTPHNTKNYKNRPPKWYPVSCRSYPGIALWGPWIPMVVSKYLFHASGWLRSYKSSPKWSQNDQKDLQYYAMNIESITVLTTLWTQAQTHLRVPLPEFIQRPRAPKQFLWAAG